MEYPIEIYRLKDFSEHNRKLIEARNPEWGPDTIMGVFYKDFGFSPSERGIEEAKKYKQECENKKSRT